MAKIFRKSLSENGFASLCRKLSRQGYGRKRRGLIAFSQRLRKVTAIRKLHGGDPSAQKQTALPETDALKSLGRIRAILI